MMPFHGKPDSNTASGVCQACSDDIPTYLQARFQVGFGSIMMSSGFQGSAMRSTAECQDVQS